MTQHARWRPDRFYWALIEPKGWRRAGAIPPGLWPAVEDEVPLDAADLFAVAAPSDGQLLVCAISRDSLALLPEGTLSLVPESVPEFARGLGVDAGRLNLLVGEAEPPVIVRTRGRMQLVAAAFLLACASASCAGLIHRARAWSEDARAATDAARRVESEALPGVQPGTLALQVQRIRSAVKPSGTSERFDAAAALASVLRGWPATSTANAHSISVSETGASVSVSVEGDPGEFLRSLRPPPGWWIDEPRLNTTGERTLVSLRLRRGKAAPS